MSEKIRDELLIDTIADTIAQIEISGIVDADYNDLALDPYVKDLPKIEQDIIDLFNSSNQFSFLKEKIDFRTFIDNGLMTFYKDDKYLVGHCNEKFLKNLLNYLEDDVKDTLTKGRNMDDYIRELNPLSTRIYVVGQDFSDKENPHIYLSSQLFNKLTTDAFGEYKKGVNGVRIDVADMFDIRGIDDKIQEIIDAHKGKG